MEFSTTLGRFLSGGTTWTLPSKKPTPDSSQSVSGAATMNMPLAHTATSSSPTTISFGAPSASALSASVLSAAARSSSSAAADHLREEDIRLSRRMRDIEDSEQAVAAKTEDSLKMHIAAMQALVSRSEHARQREQYAMKRRAVLAPKLEAGHAEANRLRTAATGAASEARAQKTIIRNLKETFGAESAARAHRRAELEALSLSRMQLVGQLRAANDKLRNMLAD